MLTRAPRLMTCFLAAGMWLGASGIGCAAPEPDEAAEDSALSALEQSIGFDGALESLDVSALARVDELASAEEAKGAGPSALERVATTRVLTEVQRGRLHATNLGFTTVYDSDLFKLNVQERALCKDARLACVRVALCALRARAASQAEYHDGNVGGRIDAFRHTYWNASMARSVGEARAKAWADAHENGDPGNRSTLGNRILSDMDFHNNASGRAIGLAHLHDWDSDVKKAVRAALSAGTLQVVRYDTGVSEGVLGPSSDCSETVHCGR